jgi:sugar phosphate isomerase/epimerase
MPTLSSFADEISPELSEQITCLKECGIRYIDLRGVWKTNVMDLTESQHREIKKMIDGEGIGIAAVGSPIGKTTIDKPAQLEMDRVKKAADIAEFYNCKYIRVFSFYPPEGKKIADYRTEIIERMKGWVSLVEKRPVVLVHENEADIYGDIPERCADLMKSLYSEKMIQCFDPANFVYIGLDNIYETCWKPLKQYVKFFHLKDCNPGKNLVACGEGRGDVAEVLGDACSDGYDGFMTMEPHLSHGGQYAGFTGPDLFKKAVRCVQDICQKKGIRLN